MYNNEYIISVDGGCRTNKSRISKELSRVINVPFLDTGFVYRAFSLFWKDVPYEQFFDKPIAFYDCYSQVELRRSGLGSIVLVNGNTIDPTIEKHAIDTLTSIIAENIPIRLYLTNVIHQYIGERRFVVSGRDIGSFVFPNTKFKIYLECDYEDKGREGLDEKMIQIIKERDDRDKNRGFAPLKKERNQLILNSNNYSIEESVNIILSYIREKGWK